MDDDNDFGHASEEKSSVSSTAPMTFERYHGSVSSSQQGKLQVPVRPLKFTLMAVGTYGDILVMRIYLSNVPDEALFEGICNRDHVAFKGCVR